MIDLGLYNFIKTARERGETPEATRAKLLQAGWSPESLDAAFQAFAAGDTPSAASSIPRIPGSAAGVTPSVHVPESLADPVPTQSAWPVLVAGYLIVTAGLAILEFLGGLIGGVSGTLPITFFYILNTSFALVFGVIGFGYLQMRKWGVYAFIGATLVQFGLITYFNHGHFQMPYSSIIYDLFVIYVGFKYLE